MSGLDDCVDGVGHRERVSPVVIWHGTVVLAHCQREPRQVIYVEAGTTENTRVTVEVYLFLSIFISYKQKRRVHVDQSIM